MLEPSAPSPITTDKISHQPIAEVNERSRGQTRCVSCRADDDHRLLESVDFGQAILGGGVQSPFQHVALHHEGSWKSPFLQALLCWTDVDDECALCHQAFELMWANTADSPPRMFDQVLDRDAHGTASPTR